MGDTQPFQISIPWNERMGCYDMVLEVGNLTKQDAEKLAEYITEWLTSESGWSQRVQ